MLVNTFVYVLPGFLTIYQDAPKQRLVYTPKHQVKYPKKYIPTFCFLGDFLFFDFKAKLYQENTVLDGDRYWLSHCNPSVYFLLPFLVLIAISWERVEKNRFRSQSANVFLIRQGTKVHFSDILRRLQNLKKYRTFL